MLFIKYKTYLKVCFFDNTDVYYKNKQIFDNKSTGDVKMLLEMLKGKIHRARITQCDIDYEGSLEIDIDLMEKAGILPYEKILVVNATNGQRLDTYAIPGAAGSKIFCLNGAAAHRGSVGDIITIMCFADFTPEEAKTFLPKVVVMDENNEVEAIRIGRQPIA